MKVRFLVLLAVICLCASLASAHEAAKKKEEAKPERRVIETSDEITEIIHHKHEKAPKEKKKEKKIIKEVVHVVKEKVKKPQKTCAELTVKEKEDCETKDVPEGYKGVFSVKEDAHCDWKCNYEALPTTPGPVTTAAPKKKKVVKKKDAKPKNLKECSGERKIHFSNCLVKINGLIAWGAKTKNFDKKFEAFLAKAKAPPKRAKAAAAKPAKKDAAKPAAAKPAAAKPAAAKPAHKPAAPKPAAPKPKA